MRRCAVCHEQGATWAWQPFGPGPDNRGFSLLGHHYRGYPALAICDTCKQRIELREDVAFVYKQQPFLAVGTTQQVVPCPF